MAELVRLPKPLATEIKQFLSARKTGQLTLHVLKGEALAIDTKTSVRVG